MKTVSTIILLLALAAGPLAAQSVEVSGQLRERSEFNDKSFIETQHHDVYHQLRTRLKAAAAVNDQVNVVAEIQDARIYGDESSTMNSGAAHFDLRQGYVEVKGIADGLLSFKLGRQALAYANERLLGAIDWHPYGQTFDAGVLRLSAGDFRIDAIGAAITRNPVMPDYTRDVFLTGAWAAWAPEKARYTVQAFFLYDNPATAVLQQYRQTAGIYAGGHFAGFDYELDAAVQMGDYKVSGNQTRNINANMVGVRVGYSFPDLAKLRIGAGFDRLSGQEAGNGDYTSFHTLYATNHKYYGFMDYFLNIPTTTTGFGLQDIIAQVSLTPTEGFSLAADLHLFSTASDPAEFGGSFAGKSQSIGTEVDLTAKWSVAKAVGMTLGYSMFSGAADRVVLMGTTDGTSWAYLMTTVNF
ncbi:MAG: alginate export family protein [Bacteroidota bacterium]